MESAQGDDVPIIGIGGIGSGDDALQYLIAGASLVAIGTGGAARSALPGAPRARSRRVVRSVTTSVARGPHRLAGVADMSTTPIVALDVLGRRRADARGRVARRSCRFYKIGNELFTAAGPSVVESRARRGLRRLSRSQAPRHSEHGARRGASAATLGVGCSRCTRSAGVRDARGGGRGGGEATCGILAVTVLTSLDDVDRSERRRAGRTSTASEEVAQTRGTRGEAGAHGVVCSGRGSGARSRAIRQIALPFWSRGFA